MLLKLLQEQAVKFVLKKFVIVGGIKVWLVTFILGEVIEEADEYLIEPALRKANLLRDTAEGKVIFGRIENAQTIEAWSNAANDV